MNLALFISLVVNGLLLIGLWHVLPGRRIHSSELAHRADQLHDAQSRVVLALEGADLGFWEWDITADRITFNARGLGMLGYQPDDVGATMPQWLKLLHPQDIPMRQASLQAYLLNKANRYECEYRIKHRNGNWVWVLDRGRMLASDEKGNATRMVGTFLDISARKDMEQKLLELANTDPLTGLANRRVFMERLQQEWAHLKRQPKMHSSVIMCDIDYFKGINDRYGHDVGDLALKHFTSILVSHTRENDLAARLGGEEFGVILQDASTNDAYLWSERLRMGVAQSSFAIPDKRLSFTVSLGLVELTPGEGSPDICLKHADQALYRAKCDGRNRSAVYDSA